eukprot:351479-Chlamydomonas_euryale.AAC.28
MSSAGVAQRACVSLPGVPSSPSAKPNRQLPQGCKDCSCSGCDAPAPTCSARSSAHRMRTIATTASEPVANMRLPQPTRKKRLLVRSGAA